MNAYDFQREFMRMRRERANAPPDPRNARRLALIYKMEKQEGRLADEEMAELAALQAHFGLPSEV